MRKGLSVSKEIDNVTKIMHFYKTIAHVIISIM